MSGHLHVLNTLTPRKEPSIPIEEAASFGPSTDLGVVTKRKIPPFARLRTPAVLQITSHFTHSAILSQNFDSCFLSIGLEQ
jgi:hypothetical protein